MKKVLLFLFIIIINTPNLFSQTNLSTNNVTSSNAIVNWDNGGCSSGSYILRYRENGAAWNQNSPITCGSVPILVDLKVTILII